MHKLDNTWVRWCEYFAARSSRPAPRILPDDSRLTKVPASVARSLAIFQLGESGGGSVIEQARRSRIPGIDANYAEAMALFVAEEHRHAELLASCVRALRGKLIRNNWAARLFLFGRRLIGLRLKVMVLLAAEVIGICYYQLLSVRLPDGELRDVLAEISADEKAHLRFHCDFLQRQVGNALRRTVFVCSWRLLVIAAALVVMADHRSALRDLGISRRSAWQRSMRNCRVAERRILRSVARHRDSGLASGYMSVSVHAPNTLTERPSRATDAVRIPVISSMTKLKARPPSMPCR